MLIVGAMIANYDTYNPIHVQAWPDLIKNYRL
jgi:hypothetical protein